MHLSNHPSVWWSIQYYCSLTKKKLDKNTYIYNVLFFFCIFLFSIFFSPLEWRILSPCCMQIWSCFSSRVSHDNPHQFGYPRSGFYGFFFFKFHNEIFDHSFTETMLLCYETDFFFFSLSSFHRCQAFKEKVCCNQTHKEFSSSFNKA